MSDLSPLSGVERKSNFGAITSVEDPGTDIGSTFDVLGCYLHKHEACSLQN
jgi:hypothetical protein